MKILKVIFTVLVIMLSCSLSYAREVQLLNPDVFGQPTSNAVKLLLDKKTDECEPYKITTDIKCGIYYSASVFYSQDIAFAETRESLNKLYKRHENIKLLKKNKIAVWRIENEGYSIQLTREKDHIRINYINYKTIEANKDCFNRN